VIRPLRSFLPDTFIIILFLTICIASIAPAQGEFAKVLSGVTSSGIVLLFFLHGARLAHETLFQAARHWRLHATIFCITFIVFPLLGLIAAITMSGLFPTDLWVGILFVCALPSTVQSSIAFTSIARGNVAGTVASAAASNLIGIGLTPVLIALLTNARSNVVTYVGIWNLVLQMLLPFVVGHLCRPWIGRWVAERKAVLSITDRGTIVLAVYSAFSAAVMDRIWQQIPLATLASLIVFCSVLLAAVLFLARSIARLFGFSREDEISIVFCGSKKSLVSGIPMARVLFAGPHVGAVLLPLMVFHQIQLIVCAWLARCHSMDRMSETAELPDES
jgi:solute carrier family 10 (sodium/bile acid cotransporter), member 7